MNVISQIDSLCDGVASLDEVLHGVGQRPTVARRLKRLKELVHHVIKEDEYLHPPQDARVPASQ